MKRKSKLLIIVCLSVNLFASAQLSFQQKAYTQADSLRGSLNENRDWWDVWGYDLRITPNINTKTISGAVTIFYNKIKSGNALQIDLQEPLIVDSVVSMETIYSKTSIEKKRISHNFKRAGNIILVMPSAEFLAKRMASITIYYHGTPKAAKRAPWDGGLVWGKDAKGNPWITTACQGLGASAWWPCKDHQSDEPDNGVMISVTVPDTLVNISNGKLLNEKADGNGNKTWTWTVSNPINLYNVSMNIGKYTHWNDTLQGLKGKLTLDYWVLDDNLTKAKQQFEQVKPMLRAFEYWFGPYPFYKDGYKLVETNYLGMEHQSAVAYGNKYMNGYMGRDLSGSGWGLKWDYIIIHETGHEWFGNNITTKDIADMWVHEGFTQYSEVIYTDYMFGRQAADEYCYGLRRNIRNDIQLIGSYGVNKEGSGDMYPKGANIIHTIRNVMNNEKQFLALMRGLNKTFYHQTVTSAQVEKYISKMAGIDLQPFFDQYLRTTQIPTLEYYFSADAKQIFVRWTNCNKAFQLPISLQKNGQVLKLYPKAEEWRKIATQGKWDAEAVQQLKQNLYINIKEVQPNP
jgi:aminopeptidase N